jgi:hypothetical protein
MSTNMCPAFAFDRSLDKISAGFQAHKPTVVDPASQWKELGFNSVVGTFTTPCFEVVSGMLRCNMQSAVSGIRRTGTQPFTNLADIFYMDMHTIHYHLMGANEYHSRHAGDIVVYQTCATSIYNPGLRDTQRKPLNMRSGTTSSSSPRRSITLSCSRRTFSATHDSSAMCASTSTSVLVAGTPRRTQSLVNSCSCGLRRARMCLICEGVQAAGSC